MVEVGRRSGPPPSRRGQRAAHRVARAFVPGRGLHPGPGLFRALVLGLALGGAALAGPAVAADDPFAVSSLERDLRQLFPATVEAKDLIFHYRPGTPADRAKEAVAGAVSDALARVVERLGVKPAAPIHVYLYPSSRDLGRMTGAMTSEAVALGGAIHVAVDRPDCRRAFVRLLEVEWASLAGAVPGRLVGGRWYKVRIRSREKKFELFLDGRKTFETELPEKSVGRAGFGIEGGRIAVQELRLRSLAGGSDGVGFADDAAWVYPLRGGGRGFEPEPTADWRASAERLEGSRPGSMSRTRFGDGWSDLELECSLRASEGASVEVFVHARRERGRDAPEKADRVALTPDGIFFAGADGRSVPVMGPHPFLRDGLVEALTSPGGPPVLHAIARVLLERGEVPPLAELRRAAPRDGAGRVRQRALAGSFVLYCVEHFGGLARYRDLHFSDFRGETTPLGEVREIDEGWRRHVRGFAALGPKEEKAALAALGLDTVAGDEKQPWKDLLGPGWDGKWELSGPGRWERRPGEGLVATPSAGPAVAKCAVEAARAALALKVRVVPGATFKATLNGDKGGGAGNSILISTRGVAIVRADGAEVASVTGLELEGVVEVLFVSEGGAARVYIDGQLVLEAPEGMSKAAGPVVLEASGQRVEIVEARLKATPQ